MKRISLVDEAHKAIQTVLKPGDRAIDATIGNGHDTLFLARQVGTSGHVFGFDIQQRAIDTTRSRLEQHENDTPVELFLASHAQMARLVPAPLHGSIKSVMFNLGYLPGGDKSLITRGENTIAALNQALGLLSPAGVITVIAYPGHTGGDREAEYVNEWYAGLDGSRYDKLCINSRENQNYAPCLYIVKIF